MKNWSKRKKMIAAGGIVAGILLISAFICYLFLYFQKPLVFMKYKSGSEQNTIVVDVKVSKIRKNFQAASFVISFNNSILSFEGLNQGNVEVLSGEGKQTKIPSWECNQEAANQVGKVSTIYLDMSAGNAPLVQRKTSGILFQIVFKIKNPDIGKQQVILKIQQATFASVNNEESLSIKKNNIRWKPLKIILK